MLKQYDCTYRILPDGPKRVISRHCPGPCQALDLIHREFQLALDMPCDSYEILELRPTYSSPYDLPVMKNPNLKEVKLVVPMETPSMDFMNNLPQGKLSA